jgi:hypothetical protein
MLCLAGPSFHDGRGSVAKAASVDESGSDGALIDESFFQGGLLITAFLGKTGTLSLKELSALADWIVLSCWVTLDKKE